MKARGLEGTVKEAGKFGTRLSESGRTAFGHGQGLKGGRWGNRQRKKNYGLGRGLPPNLAEVTKGRGKKHQKTGVKRNRQIASNKIVGKG